MIVAVIVLALVGVFYYMADPSSGLMPRCAFRYFTGYECPGCGFQRALHALLHGNVAEAWGYNPFAFFALPAAAFYIVVETLRHRYPRLHARAVHPVAIAAIFVAILTYWVARNL